MANDTTNATTRRGTSSLLGRRHEPGGDVFVKSLTF